jgi:predicted TIM-barrel fold metal-dependent hydrolase
MLRADERLATEIAGLVEASEDQARLKVIDAWAQLASPGLFEHVPEIRRLFLQSGAAHVLERGVSPEEMIAAMNAAGIDRVLISAWHRPGRSLVSNDEVAAVVRDFPTRFSGVAAVDLESPVAAVRELERAVTDLGFVALRVVPWLWNRPPSDKLYYPLYVKCVELGIPFCTQVGHTGPLMPSEPGRPIPYLDEVALTFPELVIVGGHIGYPWTDEMIALAWKHENVYIDTSAHLPRYYPQQLLHFMRTYGQSKVLFASNFPQISFGSSVAQARALDLPPEAKEAFLAGNASRVFSL